MNVLKRITSSLCSPFSATQSLISRPASRILCNMACISSRIPLNPNFHEKCESMRRDAYQKFSSLGQSLWELRFYNKRSLELSSVATLSLTFTGEVCVSDNNGGNEIYGVGYDNNEGDFYIFGKRDFKNNHAFRLQIELQSRALSSASGEGLGHISLLVFWQVSASNVQSLECWGVWEVGVNSHTNAQFELHSGGVCIMEMKSLAALL